MRKRRTRFLWIWLASLVAEVILVVIANARSRYECNPGASTTDCEAVDYILWLLVSLAVPLLVIVLGLALLFAVIDDRRSRTGGSE